MQAFSHPSGTRLHDRAPPGELSEPEYSQDLVEIPVNPEIQSNNFSLVSTACFGLSRVFVEQGALPDDALQEIQIPKAQLRKYVNAWLESSQACHLRDHEMLLTMVDFESCLHSAVDAVISRRRSPSRRLFSKTSC